MNGSKEMEYVQQQIVSMISKCFVFMSVSARIEGVYEVYHLVKVLLEIVYLVSCRKFTKMQW